ncbi:hypothetical protein [Enterobacter hormaechei]|uniref:hypothetical protein n=1 Tax=Enterobacter hormaechei TaxID=158836 RepID=UPI0010FAB412|nr:hypothetical protein [Enterobacter hormaechei]UBH30934.1 hypothetical protein LA353_17905 [Enterobacter hormaechei subsp. oharae]
MASSNQSAPQDSVTGSAGALTSKPEISAGHPIAKAFLPHQRVTTEGKAMAIDATLKVKQINSINPYGDGWNRHMEIDIDSIELVECVKPEEIISEYTAASLLDAMDESDVVRWLENEGYTVTND